MVHGGPFDMDFSSALGESLGAARRERGLTLKDVELRSQGRFKASAVGGYERGERAISLERFSMLASVYGVPPDRLLADVLDHLLARLRVVLDVTRLGVIDERTAQRVGELIHWVRSQREDYTTDVIAVRSGDVVAMAFDLDVPPSNLARKLKPAIVPEARSGSGRSLAGQRSR